MFLPDGFTPSEDIYQTSQTGASPPSSFPALCLSHDVDKLSGRGVNKKSISVYVIAILRAGQMLLRYFRPSRDAAFFFRFLVFWVLFVLPATLAVQSTALLRSLLQLFRQRGPESELLSVELERYYERD